MPTRLLREGILESERVDKLSPEAEVFYRRLMSRVDDYGLYNANIKILLAHLYPLKLGQISLESVEEWLGECVEAGLILLYESDGKPYLQMQDTCWQTRSKPKHPLPPDNNCKQVITPVYLDVVEDVYEDGEVESVFSHWQSVMNSPKTKLTPGRRQKIKTRLKNYSVDAIKSAIDGCARSEFHMGKNNTNTKHNDLELICRSDEKLEFFQNIGGASSQSEGFRPGGL